MGVEPTSNCFASSRLAIWLQRLSMSQPGIEPDLRASRARVRIRHTPRTSFFSVPHQGVEPRLVVPKTTVRPPHSQGIHLGADDTNIADPHSMTIVSCIQFASFRFTLIVIKISRPGLKSGAYLSRARSASRGDRWELNPCLLLHRQVCMPRTLQTP